MIARCTYPSHESYSGYGGRGIKICDRWFDFVNFYADMGDRPEGMTLDRYPDANGNYEPGNCRWATPVQQTNNSSRARKFMYLGKQRTLREISDISGVSMELLENRMRKGAGLTIEEAVKRPAPISISRETVDMVRQSLGKGESQMSIARRLGISQAVVCYINRGSRNYGEKVASFERKPEETHV